MKVKKTFFRWGDGVIYFVLVLLCAVLFLLPVLQRNRALTAVITVGGETVETIDLSAVEAPYTVQYAGCTISVEKDAIGFTHAACPDRLCVKTGMLRHAGSAAACVPNRVVVSLRAQTEAFDGVAY